MNRIVLYRDKQDELVLEHQHLSKRPSGNAAQRQKQLRSGWHPEWVQSSKQGILDETHLGTHLDTLLSPQHSPDGKFVEILPFASESVVWESLNNRLCSEANTAKAQQIVDEIDAQLASFTMSTMEG
jgi:hypothetical protein